jgi:Rrf2 family protein
MKTSRSVGYGLIAVYYVAKHERNGPVLSTAVAERYKVPLEYLLKIMQNLVKARILKSKRGPKGGFKLMRPLDKITMLQIIEAIDGPITFSVGLEDVKRDKFVGKCERVFAGAMEKSAKALNEIKISTLIPK